MIELRAGWIEDSLLPHEQGKCGEDQTVFPIHHLNVVSSALASCKSTVSNPSSNQL